MCKDGSGTSLLRRFRCLESPPRCLRASHRRVLSRRPRRHGIRHAIARCGHWLQPSSSWKRPADTRSPSPSRWRARGSPWPWRSRQIRDFARATGQLAKTDALDARIIALFAEAVRPIARPVPDEHARALGELVARRRQLVDMLTAEQNRRRLLRDRGLQRHLEAHVAWLEDALERLEAELTTLIRSTPIWREADDLLRSVPGVGAVTSCALIADLPELGHLDRRRIAALAGLAPVARDSGAFRGRRMIVGGRAHVRRSLYMATVAAIKYNPVIRAFFHCLVTAGRPGKVAVIAAMRKLLTILNAMLRDRRPWQIA